MSKFKIGDRVETNGAAPLDNLTFKDAAKQVRTALAGTKYAEAPIMEWGGGDGPEDIKPFLIDRKGDVELGVTCFPEGGMFFWVWADDGIQKEMASAAEAIEAFDRN